MDIIKQEMAGYRIPAYVEEILTHGHCPCFMRMTIIKEAGSYRFSYRPGNLTRIDAAGLSTLDKLILLRTLTSFHDRASGFLIRGDSYLLEPELVFSSNNAVTEDSVRIMFYPDAKKMAAGFKMMLFAERIRGSSDREEREIFDQLRSAAEGGDMNRIRMFLDKNITRIEYRYMSKAG